MKVKYISLLVLALLLIAALCVFIFYKQTKNAQTRKQTIRKMCMIGILSALSIILYFIKTPLPFFVSFLEIQFSNLPVLLGSFMFGPIEGAMIAIVRTIVKIPFTLIKMKFQIGFITVKGGHRVRYFWFMCY